MTTKPRWKRNFDDALNWLINATHVDGEEFPDACSRAARMFSVNYDALRDAYDEYCARPRSTKVY